MNMTCIRSATILMSVSFFTAVNPVAAQSPDNPRILRFLEGVDGDTKLMEPADVAQLNDPWAVLILRENVFPKYIQSALAALDPAPGATGYSKQLSFFVSESGLLPLDATVVREFRMVVTRAQPTDGSPAILMSAPAGEREGFIELMSWDPTKKAFNFYRRPKGTDWVWRGDTRDAFRSASAGKGCFECHVHGAPIMKEMRAPWNNWNSQSARIPPEAIPSKEIRESTLFTNKRTPELLEPIIRAWEFQPPVKQATARIQQPQ